MNINFGSTYRVEISQTGVNKAKKAKLKELATKYDALISSSKDGFFRVSLPNEDDIKFEKDLKNIGYKQYQKFEAENLNKNEIDAYIKKNLPQGNYEQYGKQKEGMPKKKRLYC